MRKQYLKVLFGFACVLALGVRSEAQTPQLGIKVVLPFEFTTSGKTLPAGTYSVSRVDDEKLSGLILRSDKTGESVLVHVTSVGSAQTAKPSVAFNRVGESYVLSKIAISGDVYSLPVAGGEPTKMEAKSVHGAPSSANSGHM